MLEVDLEYPDKLHELNNGCPLTPEKLCHNMFSNYCSSSANEYKIVNKLVPNSDNKSKCVLHYRNLRLYLSVGMKLVKVHRILNFKAICLVKKIN